MQWASFDAEFKYKLIQLEFYNHKKSIITIIYM